MKVSFVLYFSIISTFCFCQNNLFGLSFQDSLFISSNSLSENFIKIKYIGEQDKPVAPIYIENVGKCDTSKCIVFGATSIFYMGFTTTIFKFLEGDYILIKKSLINNMKNVHYDSSFNRYGGFEICIASKNHTDTMYVYSFQFFEDFKKDIYPFGLALNWLCDIITSLEKETKYYIKPDKFNKLEK